MIIVHQTKSGIEWIERKELRKGELEHMHVLATYKTWIQLWNTIKLNRSFTKLLIPKK